MINKIKKLKKFITCNFPITEGEKLQHAEVAGYNKAINDVCKLFPEKDEMKNAHNSIKEVKIVNELEYSEGTMVQSDCDDSSKQEFEIDEKVVWDSHFGYEIGCFLGEGNSYNTYLIDVKSGLIQEPCSHSKDEIHRYSNELIDKMFKKYGYEKRFW